MFTQNKPPYSITTSIVTQVAQVSEAVGRLSALEAESKTLRLRRINRIRTIQGSLAIERNTLSRYTRTKPQRWVHYE
ncbi:MAG: hypothetical protein JJE30_10330 [Desulfuromonadales bacterium]|nr:hypothetical protein [Desulfuromonadales bacterium]